MFRPMGTLRLPLSLQKKTKEFVRNKIIRPVSILKPADKIKLYNKENKELFGPLLETNKQRKQQLRKTVKNNRVSSENNTVNTPNDNSGTTLNCLSNVLNSSKSVNSIVKYNPLTAAEIMKTNMWQNTRNLVNYVGALLNNTSVRTFKTATSQLSAHSSAAQAGYPNDDKILQIKPHRNDFAQQYPSVTLILNKTMTDESRKVLEAWKKEKIAEIGEDEFNKYYEAQMAVGTKLHNTIKNYFTQPLTQLRIEKDVEGVWNSVSDVLKSISSPKAIESNVVHPVLKYRGIFDAIADYEDKPTLIEWKKSDKPRKSLSLTYDNPVQLAAYFGAVSNDLNYKHLNVREALLVIAYTDGSKADVYRLSTDKLREHWAQWLSRLEQYMVKHGGSSEKILKGGKRLFEEDIANLQ